MEIFTAIFNQTKSNFSVLNSTAAEQFLLLRQIVSMSNIQKKKKKKEIRFVLQCEIATFSVVLYLVIPPGTALLNQFKSV